MLVDLILIALLLLAALWGVKAGLFDMLGRLLILLLSLGLTLLVLGPVTRFLLEIPWLAPLGAWLAHPVVARIEAAALSVEEAITQFALPPLLEALMTSELASGNNEVNAVLPELTATLFRFALTAAIFVILFALISFLIHRLTGLLTRWSDDLPLIGTLNRAAGFLAGAVFGLVIVNILLLLAGLLAPYFPELAGHIAASRLAGRLYLMNFLLDLIATP
ncbi:MAG: hypothetical protein GX821_11765 [Clostridiaceae bacterium]|nr:hypothetical protein [Eubacteriales bacterium]NLB45821.1 hypothetical protein [Clostridiaceae bacterium]